MPLQPGPPAPTSPSGTQLPLVLGSTTATVVTLGAGLRELHHDGRALVHGYDARTAVPYCRGQVLAPWPNRVAGGRYPWAGTVQQLPITEPRRDAALHGLVCWHEWTVLERSAAHARLGTRVLPQPGYPHALQLTVDYQLVDGGIDSTITATNTGHDDAPWGTGVHPYLQVGDGTVDDCELRLGAGTVLETDANLIPTGHRQVAGTAHDFRDWAPLRGVSLDDAYTDVPRGADGRIAASVRAGGQVTTVWGDASCSWWQVCTGDEAQGPWRRAGVALEPMTCPPNAFATGEDLLTLAAGATTTTRWGLHDGEPR